MTNQPPHSREAEEAVIGSIFIDPENLDEVSEIVGQNDFYIHRNGLVFSAMKRIRAKKQSIDIMTVADELGQSLDDVGGSAYLTATINQSQFSTNAVTYAKIVKDYSLKRGLIVIANKAATSAYSNKPYLEALDGLKKDVEVAESKLIIEDDFQPLKEVFSEVYDEANERSLFPREIWGIRTGLDKLDRETGGQQQGEVTYWVGEPGIGKTWLLTGIGIEMAKQCEGGFLSMELKKQNIARRILSGTSGVPTRKIRTGFIEAEDWDKINRSVEENSELPLFLMYRSVTSTQLYHIVRQAKKRYNFKFLIVDYAMLFIDNAKDETERTGIVSRNLKNIATTFDVAVNCIHSVVKPGMDSTEPQKANMRGSGQQLHDADNVYFLTAYKQTSEKDGFLREAETKRMATLWCKKGRELENSDFHIHLVRQGLSPFFGEYNRDAALLDRGLL
ncbi:MAG: hypothetical protein FJZ86_18300 [Chloroflexi bacterium]|nr:hypothetical protein [Chloroflexota bacterium]